MEEILKLLLNPQVLAVVGPVGILALLEFWGLWHLFHKYSDLQDKRILEWKQMNDEYRSLSEDLNKTLDILIKTIKRDD